MRSQRILGSAGIAAFAISSAYAASWWTPPTGVGVSAAMTSKPVTVVTVTPTAKPSPTPTPKPTPAPTAAATTSSSAVRESVQIGNSPALLSQYQSWLGRSVDAVQLHGGAANWSDWKSSLSWQAGLFRGLTSDILWSVPLIPKGATLDEAAKGTYDANYRALAQQFISLWPNDKQIDLRVGWEFNGTNWNAWSAVGKPTQYKGAFRHFVAAFRAVAPNRFIFEWTPNVGNVGMDPTTAYPGDDVVDIIGMDFYYDTKWLGADPTKAWNYMVTQKWGLQWHQDFAEQHHKPTSYAEWGINSDKAGPYIQLAAKWFEDHHVLYQNYWNSNSAFPGDLSHGQYPHAAATFKATFGSRPIAGPVLVPGK